MKNFEFLNLNIPLFKEGININDVPKLPITKLKVEDYINPELINFFNSLDLKISLLETFFKKAGHISKGTIHIDGSGDDHIKCNWVFGSGLSKMCWYRQKPNLKKSLIETKTNTLYTSFLENEVEFIESTAIKNPTLVQVGVPHNIINVTEDRLCVSMVITDKFTGNFITMKQALDIFKNYITSS